MGELQLRKEKSKCTTALTEHGIFEVRPVNKECDTRIQIHQLLKQTSDKVLLTWL